MKSLSQVSKELNLSKQELLELIYKKTWKSYSPKTSKISDSVYDKIKSDLSEESVKNSSVKEKIEDEKSKVATAEDIFSEEWSFLSELWFSTEEKIDEKSQKEDLEDDDLFASTKKTISSWNKTTFTQKKSFNDNKKTSQTQKATNIEKDKKEIWSDDSKKTQITVRKKSDKPAYDNKNQKSSGWGQSYNAKTSSASKSLSGWSDEKKLTKKEKKKQKISKDEKKSETNVKKEEAPKVSETLKKKEKIVVSSTISIKEFSEKMGIPLQEVMKKLLANKIVLPVTANIDFDTASLIWEELWVKVENEWTDVSVEELLSWDLDSILAPDKKIEEADVRPPVVAVMWHVDHWKTKLLDYIRKTDKVEWEAWWITQSIWASQVHHNDQKITFIDTPWHELFTSLRARGTKITDVAVIVVAADDWIQQQTIEAINHAKEAWVPIIVAITKIDLPNSNIENIKWRLAEFDLIPEDWWWDTITVPLSSITWQWISDLMDMILLQSEMLELKYDPQRKWVWVILESDKDSKKWITASTIVMTGNLNVWDVVVVWETFWRVRKLTNWKHQDVKTAYAWDPVQILWIQDLPKPWKILESVSSEKDARAKIQAIQEKASQQTNQSWMQNILDQIWKWDKVQLKLILKADSFWSLEAVKYAVEKLEMPENIELKIIHNDVWDVSDSDIILWNASEAFVVWFNVKVSWSIKKKAESQKVVVKSFDVIYELIDYVDRLSKWLVKPEEKEVYIWRLEVLWVFFKRGKEMIVWGKVLDWEVRNWSFLKAYRWEEQVSWWKITSLKREQENVNTVTSGHECWMKIKVSKKIQEWDILEFHVIE